MVSKAEKKEAKALTAKKGEATAPKAEKEEVKSKSSGGGNRWLNFVKSFREKNALKEDKIPSSGIFKEAGRLWQDMSESQKDMYETVAK